MNPISRWVSAGIAGLASLAAFAEPPAAAPAAASARPAAMVGEFENQSTFRDPAFLRSFRTRIETEIGNTRKFVIVDRDPSAFRYRKTETDLADAGLAGANVVAPGDENLTLAGFALSGTVLHFHISPGQSAEMRIELHVTRLSTLAKSVPRTVFARFVPEGRGRNVPDSALLDGVLAEASRKVVGSFLEYAYPPKILSVGEKEISVLVTDMQAEVGDLFDVLKTGEELFDEDTGESLGFDETKAGRIRITRPGPKFSKAAPVAGTKLSSLAKGMLLRRVTDEQLEEERDRRALSR